MATTAAHAQDAQERAGELKAWREQCNHPDPDLRLAYLEAALETNDASIERICVRLALQSDNADIRNLGLRAAIAQRDQIFFEVSIPPQLQAEYDRAVDDRDRLKEMSGWYIVQDYNTIQSGLVFDIKNSSINSSQSDWLPLGGRSRSDDRYRGKASIVGDTITWQGNAYLARDWTCTLYVRLNNAAALEGTFQCRDLWPYPVSASLL
tara:strand:- start:31 stop:654 length:624 start_codon:yes stop_codon:yes gene_type:complete